MRAIAWTIAREFHVSTGNSALPTKEGVHKGRRFRRTLAGWVLAEVLGLVSAKETSVVDFGSRASRELVIEVDDSLHTHGIGGGTDSLKKFRQRFCLYCEFIPPSFMCLRVFEFEPKLSLAALRVEVVS